jgi:hypothetical protein
MCGLQPCGITSILFHLYYVFFRIITIHLIL